MKKVLNLQNLVISFLFLAACSIEPDKNQDPANQGFKVDVSESTLDISYDSIVVPKAEKIRFIGGIKNRYLFLTSSNYFIITSQAGEIEKEVSLIGEREDRAGKYYIQTNIYDNKLVILNSRGIDFYSTDGELLRRVSQKFSRKSVRTELYYDVIEGDSVFVINPQKAFFDFKKNNPGDPKTLTKYYESYYSAMIYSTAKPFIDSSELILDFPENSIFKEYKYHYPDYKTLTTYDSLSKNLYYFHNPDTKLYSYNLLNSQSSYLNLDLPSFEVEYKTELNRGMSGANDMEKARILNSAIVALKFLDNSVYVNYRLGLPESYLFENDFTRYQSRTYMIARVNLSDTSAIAYRLPKRFGELQGNEGGQLIFKSKNEHENFEIFYRVLASRL